MMPGRLLQEELTEVSPGVYEGEGWFYKRSDAHHRPFTGDASLLELYVRARDIGFYPPETRFSLEWDAIVMAIPALRLGNVQGRHVPKILALADVVPPERMHGDVWTPQNYGFTDDGEVYYFDLELLKNR